MSRHPDLVPAAEEMAATHDLFHTHSMWESIQHRGKWLELLIPALARLKMTSAMLIIAGPDIAGFGPTVRGLIDQHNLADRVILTGMLNGPERIEALADADLFSMPSYHENFGIA